MLQHWMTELKQKQMIQVFKEEDNTNTLIEPQITFNPSKFIKPAWLFVV